MDERLKFVARCLDGEKMAALCQIERCILQFKREYPTSGGSSKGVRSARSLRSRNADTSVPKMISSHFVMGLTLAGRSQKVQQIQLSRIFERTTLVECEVLHRETTAESHD